MSINESVFPSKKERDGFEHLKSRWNSEYHLFPNLPFLQVLNTYDLFDFSDPNTIKPLQIAKEDLQRLKKTSIDYTLCDKEDKPLLSIEFDGVNNGFNTGFEYKSKQQINEWRKIITELKIKIALASNYPFFVLSSLQFVYLEQKEKLAIVDCIIGSVLASKEMRRKFDVGFDPIEYGYTQDEFEKLSIYDQESIIEDWGIGIEVESNFDKNPLYNLVYTLENELEIKRMGYGNIESPMLMGISNPQKRLEIFEKVDQIGATAWVELDDGNKIFGTVWIPNFKSYGYSHYNYIYELATYIALVKAKKIKLRKERKDSKKK